MILLMSVSSAPRRSSSAATVRARQARSSPSAGSRIHAMMSMPISWRSFSDVLSVT